MISLSLVTLNRFYDKSFSAWINLSFSTAIYLLVFSGFPKRRLRCLIFRASELVEQSFRSREVLCRCWSAGCCADKRESLFFLGFGPLFAATAAVGSLDLLNWFSPSFELVFWLYSSWSELMMPSATSSLSLIRSSSVSCFWQFLHSWEAKLFLWNWSLSWIYWFSRHFSDSRKLTYFTYSLRSFLSFLISFLRSKIVPLESSLMTALFWISLAL